MEETFISNGRNAVETPIREINVKEWFDVIQRRWWIAVICTLIFAVLGGLYSTRTETPLYSASSRIVIKTESSELLGTLKAFAREPIVMGQVRNSLQLTRSVGFLRSQISISSVDGSLITLVTAVDADPDLAVQIANATVKAYSEQLTDVFPGAAVRVLTEAEPDEHPSPINPPSNRAFYISIFAGIAIGIGIIFLVDSLDDSIRTRRDVERHLDTALLGQVTRFKRKELTGRGTRKPVQKRGETTIGK
ncbi:Wzz/FepE/Etk N-terminal domain-containing protein [Cohnella ginsengisoli]|uniref:Wzz/FepE/Etk N-terminal domain-containing protein n=1 Tax=Cohnella ginsengisoli TaxID=425004 RepID=A0A9X4KGE5_9BACL|nr:Wzz/FepE/Etk N-terminal domain-containing protein [Cohnella ginsengisoli]MDG0791789.1 Wzz/FepE/Etk N-terminal domain-containing protein [Cohnella ginsengisoli]